MAASSNLYFYPVMPHTITSILRDTLFLFFNVANVGMLMQRMSLYGDLYEAFSKRYASELSKRGIQEKCNESWKNLKIQYRGEELKVAVDKKISELMVETKSIQSSLLRFFAQASTSKKCSGSDRPSTPAEFTGCGSLATPDFDELLGDSGEDPSDAKSNHANILKRKYTTPSQDLTKQKIIALQGRLSSDLQARDIQLDLDIENSLKKTRKELSTQQQILKIQQKNNEYQAKYRSKVKEKHKEAAICCTDIGVRSQVGRSRLKENREGLLDAIKAAAIYGSAAHERRQTDEIKCCRTLEELQTKVQEAGFTISRSALYTRLIPRNSRTGQGSRHVVTVPIRLSKPSNDLHKQHPDGKFCTATLRSLEALASMLGPKQCFFLSQDDKARVPIGITAAKEQQSLVMHVEYRVQLPDHDFVIGQKHKLIPSVYAGINIKSSGNGDRKDVTYSGPTFIAVRSGKHAQSTAATHSYDIKTLLNEPSFSETMKTDKGDVKPIIILTVDGGPDENPRFPKTIAFAIQHFCDFNLDAIFVATNAPGRSAFNRVERRMAQLSKQLSGVILPYDTYGTHLNGQGKTCDHELELKNFEAAGKTLANLWSELVIDSYPVTACYEGPSSEAELPEPTDATWYARHVRESQYFLQVVKCDSVDCCGKLRSDLKTILKDGFLPPPVKIIQDPGTGRLRWLVALENEQGCHFLPLFQSLVTRLPMPCETIPNDFGFPSVQGDVVPGRRICKACGLYFASITAADSHHRVIHSFHTKPGEIENSAVDGCRRSQRIVAKIAKRGKKVLCRTIHPLTDGEDVEWLEEKEIPTDVPDEVPSDAAASDDLPIVSDWASWLTNPFSPDDN